MASDPRVLDLQRAINSYRGHQVLAEDGVMGPRTRGQVRQLRREHNLDADTTFDSSVVRALRRPDRAPTSRLPAPTSSSGVRTQPGASAPAPPRVEPPPATPPGTPPAAPRTPSGAPTPLRVSAPTPAAPTPPGEATAAIADRLRQLNFTITNLPGGGIQARGRIPGYSEPVSMFIPKDFQPRDQVPLALHLHGFTLGGTVQDQVYRRFDFEGMMRSGSFNGVVVVPESRDRVATYNAELSSAPQFDRVLTGVTRALGSAGAITRFDVDTPQAGVSRILLSGHSGAYLPIASLARRESPFLAKVEGLALFDATYSPGNAGRHYAFGNAVVQRGGLFYLANIGGSATAPAGDAVRASFGDRAWHRTLGRDASGAPTRGAVFLTERPDRSRDQHWQVFARRYAEFLGAFADRPQ